MKNNNNKKITKAIIPAAGFGTRFLPATKAQPKEMLPVVDKPVIQYVVEEAVAAGIEDIIMVTSWQKRTLEDHFDYSLELEKQLKERGKFEQLKEVRRIADTGQADTQDGSAQCMHCMGRKRRLTSGYSPTSQSATKRHTWPAGRPCSCMQAIVQVWQPTQRLTSITMPQRIRRPS